MDNQACDVGVLFGDVAGSTRLYETFGDRVALVAIGACLRLMTDSATKNGATVVKTIGDEIMAVFHSPGAMFSAAVEMQRKINALPPLQGPPGQTKLCVRVGFHFGPTIVNNDDYFGDTVNLAARMAGIAKGEQIMTTGTMIELVSPWQRKMARVLDRLAVKGKAEDISVFEVIWQENAETTQFNVSGLSATASRRLTLRAFEREWLFDNSHQTVAIGREPGNDVIIHDHGVSRRHATIERRRDKWVLIDHSSNGTFVTFGGEQEIRLHREELILHRTGMASFGHPADASRTACVHFVLT
jgi:class 3 adenylate cyclase